jgi:hypothetical protein
VAEVRGNTKLWQPCEGELRSDTILILDSTHAKVTSSTDGDAHGEDDVQFEESDQADANQEHDHDCMLISPKGGVRSSTKTTRFQSSFSQDPLLHLYGKDNISDIDGSIQHSPLHQKSRHVNQHNAATMDAEALDCDDITEQAVFAPTDEALGIAERQLSYGVAAGSSQAREDHLPDHPVRLRTSDVDMRDLSMMEAHAPVAPADGSFVLETAKHYNAGVEKGTADGFEKGEAEGYAVGLKDGILQGYEEAAKERDVVISRLRRQLAKVRLAAQPEEGDDVTDDLAIAD